MSLTSYRAAPPRAKQKTPAWWPGSKNRVDWKTWRRPTLPCLKTQYHGRWGFSRPSSGWDRVRAPRQSHQVVQSTLMEVVRFRSSVAGRPGWRFWIVLCADPSSNLGMISMHGGVLEPIGRLVPVSSMGYPMFTPGLST